MIENDAAAAAEDEDDAEGEDEPEAGPDERPAILVVFNMKGGIGKTTTSVNLAVALAALGRSVVLIDLDCQGNATTSLGFVGPFSAGAAELMAGTATLAKARKKTRWPRLWVCGATSELAATDFDLAVAEEPHKQLARALERLPKGIDFVVIDCPPALGLLPVNAMVAGDAVLLPVAPEPMARDGLHSAWHHIQQLRVKLKPSLGIAGILLTMTEAEEVHRGMAEAIRAEFGGRMFDVEVPRDAKVVQANMRDLPVVVADPAGAASQAYVRLAAELAHRAEGGTLDSVKAAGPRDPDAPDPEPDDSRYAAAIEAATGVLAGWSKEVAAGAPPALPLASAPEISWRDALDRAEARIGPPSLWLKLAVAFALMALGGLMGFVAGLWWTGALAP